MSNTGDDSISTIQKVTRSLSFKLSGSKKENVRNGAKRSMPQKLDTNNWFQDNKSKSSHQKEVPPCNLRFVIFNQIIGYSKIFDETMRHFIGVTTL